MTFEDVLTELTGRIGARVAVSAGPACGAEHVLFASGTLRAGRELGDRDGAGPGFYFSFAEDEGSGFFLEPGAFRSARVEDGVLRVVTGGVVLDVGHAPD